MSIDFPREEEEVLKRWKEIHAFERQVRRGNDIPNSTVQLNAPRWNCPEAGNSIRFMMDPRLQLAYHIMDIY